MMNRSMIALRVTAALALAGAATAQMHAPMSPAAPLSKEGYATAKKDADAQFKVDREACASLSGNAKDICMAKAKGNESVAKSGAQAAYENTAKARENARIAHAQAVHDVAIEECDDLAGNRKDVCVKEAKAALVKGKANAKVDRVAAETRQDGAAKRAEARDEAGEATRSADYKVAIEKCDALAGPAKDSCVGSAKMLYGKS